MVTVVCIVMYQRHDYRFYSIILLLVLPTVTVTLSNHVTCCWYCVLLRAYLAAAAADRQLTSVNIAINWCSFSVHATNAYTRATQWSTQHCRFNRGCVGGLGEPPSTHWTEAVGATQPIWPCGEHTDLVPHPRIVQLTGQALNGLGYRVNPAWIRSGVCITPSVNITL